MASVSLSEFMSLNKQNEENSKKRIRLEERLESFKKALAAKVKEIEVAGFDPRTLDKEVSRMEEELAKDMAEYAAAVDAETRALEGIEALL